MKTESLRLRSKKLIWLIFSAVILLVFTQLAVSHRLATAGERVKKFETEAESLAQENVFLNEEISKMGSLSRISSEAAKLGLERASRILHLTPQIPVALGK